MSKAENIIIPSGKDESPFMHNPGEWFWSEEPTIAEREATAHYIIRTIEEETPAGTDCEEYQATCGKSAWSWYSPAMGVPKTLFSSSLPSDVNICGSCNQVYLEKQEVSDRRRSSELGD